MAKKTRKPQNPPQRQPKGAPVQAVDRSVIARTVDRSRQTLERWRTALTSAESVVSPSRALLYDIYADAVIDDHLKSVLKQRRLALTRTRLVFKRDGDEVESISELATKRFFRLLLKFILEAQHYGFHLIEVKFGQHSTRLVPRANVIPSRNIVTPTPYDQVGVDYTKGNFPTWNLAVGEPDDLGDLLSAVPLVLLKRGDILDWATFNEMFGIPLRKGTYNPLDSTQKGQLKEELENMGSKAYVVVPEGTNVEFVESSQKAGAKDTFFGLADYCDKALSKLVVGQTMTTQDGSSKSQGEVHERLAEAITKDDQDYVLSYLNEHVVDMLIKQGFSDAQGGRFEFIEEEQKQTKKERLDMLLSIHEKVGPIKKEQFKTHFGAEFVDESDEVEPTPDQADDDPAPDDQDKEKPKRQGAKPAKAQPPAKGKARLSLDMTLDEFTQWMAGFFVKAPIR